MDAKKRELADLQDRKKLDEQNLAEAQASNDPAKIAAAYLTYSLSRRINLDYPDLSASTASAYTGRR